MKAHRPKYEPRQADFADDDWLTPNEAALYLKCSRNALYEAIKRNEIPGVFRVGRRITIYKPALIAAATASTGSREARDV